MGSGNLREYQANRAAADGRHQVAAKNVRFGSEIAEDEIDLDGGFVMIPEAIPAAEPCFRLGDLWGADHDGRCWVGRRCPGLYATAVVPIEDRTIQLRCRSTKTLCGLAGVD